MISPAHQVSTANWTGWTRAFLVLGLVVAAAIHLLLTPDHFAESALMGAGFLSSAVAEFGLAAAVLVKPRGMVYFAVIGVASALIALYAYNVMIGLPFSEASPATHPAESVIYPDIAEHSTPADHGSEHEAVGHAEGAHQSGGLVLGQGEPVDLLGAATKLSELATIGLALALILQSRASTGRPRGRAGARQGKPR
jgi:hypothetical protein